MGYAEWHCRGLRTIHRDHSRGARAMATRNAGSVLTVGMIVVMGAIGIAVSSQSSNVSPTPGDSPNEFFSGLPYRYDNYYNIEGYATNYTDHQYDYIQVNRSGNSADSAPYYTFCINEGVAHVGNDIYSGKSRNDDEPLIAKLLKHICGTVDPAYRQCWTFNGYPLINSGMEDLPTGFAAAARGTFCTEGGYIIVDMWLYWAAGGPIAASTTQVCQPPTPEKLAELNVTASSQARIYSTIQCTYIPEHIHFRFDPNKVRRHEQGSFG
jgi:hypothetical protein